MSEHRNGSGRRELSRAPRRNGDSRAVELSAVRRGGRLADGMAIAASVRARLFGLQLLTLDADVTVTPRTPARSRVARAGLSARRRRTVAAGTGTGADGGLADAARHLDAGAAELAAARERMP